MIIFFLALWGLAGAGVAALFTSRGFSEGWQHPAVSSGDGFVPVVEDDLAVEAEGTTGATDDTDDTDERAALLPFSRRAALLTGVGVSATVGFLTLLLLGPGVLGLTAATVVAVLSAVLVLFLVTVVTNVNDIADAERAEQADHDTDATPVGDVPSVGAGGSAPSDAQAQTPSRRQQQHEPRPTGSGTGSPDVTRVARSWSGSRRIG